MIIIDIEATGLDFNNASILSIGALDLNNPNYQFYGECRIWDGASVSDTSLEINGFTQKEIKDPYKISESQLVKNFYEWAQKVDDMTIGSQNTGSLDLHILKAATLRAGEERILGHRVVDIHSVAYFYFKKKGLDIPINNNRSDLGLTDISKFVGLDEEPFPHNALTGAKYQAECFYRMLYGKNLLEDFQEFPIVEN